MKNTRIDWQRWLPWLVGVGVLTAAYYPLLAKFFGSLWNRPHYQHFPFVLGAFAWLLWKRYQQGTPRSLGEAKWSGWLSAILLATAWVLLALAYYAHSPWLAAVSLVVLVAGFLARLQRVRTIQNAWGIWLCLWLIVPLPTHPDQQLIAVLQRASSHLSSLLLDWMGILHLMSGNVLQLKGTELFVDEACSGIVSLLSIVACAVIYAVWNNRSLVVLLLLTLAGIGWATLMNVLRITVIAFALDRWEIDLSEGLSHEVLGLVIFLLSFLALVSTDRLLHWGLAPIANRLYEFHGELPRYGHALIAFWDRLLTPRAEPARVALAETASVAMPPVATGAGPRRWVFGVTPLVAFGLMGGLQFVYGDWLFDLENQQSRVSQNALVLENAAGLEADHLPAQYSTYRQTRFEPKERDSDNVFGKYSQTYEYENVVGNRMLVSCDYPFSGGWHELAICYQGIGWEQTDRQIVAAPSSQDGEVWSCVEVEFAGRDGTQAFLAYCQFDEYGNAIEPPTSTFLDYIRQRLQRPTGSLQGKQYFQVQVWLTQVGDVSEEQREIARELLLATRDRFRGFITNSD